MPAHRFAYERAHGPIKEGFEICHRCDTPECVNPDHLFAGTHLDNMVDRDSKGRRLPPKGEDNGTSKLTDQAVNEIRMRYANGARQVDLAARFGVSQSLISLVVLRKAWRHLT